MSLENLRKDLSFDATLAGYCLRFHTTWGIFSPRAIDEGSVLLLHHLQVKPDDLVLDMGCGYGPLGLCIAKQAVNGQVSNLPAKVGNEFFQIMFDDALRQMQPGARIVVVTINGLRGFIKRSFNEVFGNYSKLKQGKTYTVSMAVKES